MTPLLYQNEAGWGRLVLGSGPGTIGGKGCVLTSVVNAARELGTRPTLTPREANTSCLVSEAFDGQALNVQTAAELYGMSAPYSGRHVLGDGSDLKEALERALTPGGLALVRVDYIGREPSNDGRHTILAREFSRGGQQVECWDPAVGRLFLSFPSLGALAVWSPTDKRTYRVVKVHPVRLLAT